MNPNDDFEAQLLARIPRRIPDEWRTEILRAAERERDEVANLRPWGARLKLVNYMALASAWAIIFALYYLNSEFRKLPGRASESVALRFARGPWLEQRRQIAELLRGEPIEERKDVKPSPAEVPFRSGSHWGRANRSRIV